jgi:hypothetical protein
MKKKSPLTFKFCPRQRPRSRARLALSLLPLALAFALPVLAWADAGVPAAGDAFIVTVPTAAIYGAPSDAGAPSGKVARGRVLKANGQSENGFIGLSTKSGKTLWIRGEDVRSQEPAGGSEQDLQKVSMSPEQEGRSGGRNSAGESAGRDRDWGLHYPPRATFDLGASSGSYSSGGNTYSYTELNLGLNLFFAEWLDWRNAVFYRLVSGADNIYGLDTSLRGILGIGGRGLGLTLFAGPGYRFPNEGGNVPFAEAGVIFKASGFALGGGIRTFLNSWVSSGVANDTQYFIILSGGGSL